MDHPIYRIERFEKAGMYALRVFFDDESVQTIDFYPVLHGALFGALTDKVVFDQVAVDDEVHTLVWPNGADFDPATLHDWPLFKDAMIELARRSAALIDA
jgi:hypothetical protein